MSHFDCRLRALGRVLLQARRYHLLPNRRHRCRLDVQVSAPLGHRWRHSLVDLSIDVTGIKRRLAREQFVNAGPQRIDVIEMSAPLAFELLRTHVSECAASAAGLCYHAHRIFEAAGDSKIGHLEFAALIDHHIGWLEIAMDDVRVVVGVVERIAELAHPIG